MTSDETVGYVRMLDRINAGDTKVDFQIIENPPGIGASALKLAVRMKAGKQFKDGILKTDAHARRSPTTPQPTKSTPPR